MKKYSFMQKLIISFFGRVQLEERTQPGCKVPLMFYAFNCPIHGIVENYPMAHNGRLICPKCIEDKWKYV